MAVHYFHPRMIFKRRRTALSTTALALDIADEENGEAEAYTLSSTRVSLLVKPLRLPSKLAPKPRHIRMRIQIHILVHLTAIPTLLLRSIEPRIDI